MHVKLHSAQSKVFRALFINKTARFMPVVAARGFGKSYLAAAAATKAIYELLALHASVPNKDVYIVAPTFDQVKDIFYPILAYDFGLKEVSINDSRERGFFIFNNNVRLKLVSYEAIERLRGKGAYFVVLDEVTSWIKGAGLKNAWESVLLPMLTSRWSKDAARRFQAPSAGRAMIISTPKGYDYFYDLYNMQEQSDDWSSFHFDYHTSPYLDPAEVERIKGTIDPLSYAREYLASFEESGSNLFYCFDRKVHVNNSIEDFYLPKGNTPGETVHAFIDFNVGINATSLWALRGNQLFGIDEHQGTSDTETLAIALKAKYSGHPIIAYPDPTGKSRKTSAKVGRTDFSILKENGIIVKARNGSPPIVDSVNAVNRMFMTARGDINMWLHPRMRNTIKSVERTAWVDNNAATLTIDKSDNIEHWSDGIRYGTEFMFPVNAGRKTSARNVKRLM